MIKLDEEMKAQLGNHKVVSEAVDKKSVEGIKAHIKRLYEDNNILDLKKLLGVLYTPIINLIFDDDMTIDEAPLISYGLTAGSSDEDLVHFLNLVTLFYVEEEFKEYGDTKVIEALNYFMLENGETVHKYWSSIKID